MKNVSNMRRDRFFGAAVMVVVAGWLSCTASVAVAQPAAWPGKPVKVVVSFPPGGPADALARTLADVWQKALGQPVVVDNKAGAAGNIGADAVAKSAPDGLTVLIGIDSTFTVNPHIYPTMPFKVADLKPVMVMASSGLLVGVNPGTGIKTMADLVARGKSRGLNFSSAGSGSPGHLAAEVFTDAAGINITHIPYKGNTPAVTAVLAGEVDGGVLATPGLLPHVKAGKVTAVAVTGRQRSPLAPDIPTVAEAGFKILEQEVLYVAMVPAATPESVMQALQKAFVDGMAHADVKSRLANLDMQVEGLTGAVAAKRLTDLSSRYSRVIKATGMKVD